MIEENKEIRQDKDLISPEKINKKVKKILKKISIGKNDIVEREEGITTEDGRQLLK